MHDFPEIECYQFLPGNEEFEKHTHAINIMQVRKPLVQAINTLFQLIWALREQNTPIKLFSPALNY